MASEAGGIPSPLSRAGSNAAAVIARQDRIPIWSLSYLFIGIIGMRTGLIFSFQTSPRMFDSCMISPLDICSTLFYTLQQSTFTIVFQRFVGKTLPTGKARACWEGFPTCAQAHSHCKRFAGARSHPSLSCTSFLTNCTPVGRSPTARLVCSSTGVGEC